MLETYLNFRDALQLIKVVPYSVTQITCRKITMKTSDKVDVPLRGNRTAIMIHGVRDRAISLEDLSGGEPLFEERLQHD